MHPAKMGRRPWNCEGPQERTIRKGPDTFWENVSGPFFLAFFLRSDLVEAVQGHDLGPGINEVAHELILPAGFGIDLCNGAQLGM